MDLTRNYGFDKLKSIATELHRRFHMIFGEDLAYDETSQGFMPPYYPGYLGAGLNLTGVDDVDRNNYGYYTIENGVWVASMSDKVTTESPATMGNPWPSPGWPRQQLASKHFAIAIYWLSLYFLNIEAYPIPSVYSEVNRTNFTNTIEIPVTLPDGTEIESLAFDDDTTMCRYYSSRLDAIEQTIPKMKHVWFEFTQFPSMLITEMDFYKRNVGIWADGNYPYANITLSLGVQEDIHWEIWHLGEDPWTKIDEGVGNPWTSSTPIDVVDEEQSYTLVVGSLVNP